MMDKIDVTARLVEAYMGMTTGIFLEVDQQMDLRIALLEDFAEEMPEDHVELLVVGDEDGYVPTRLVDLYPETSRLIDSFVHDPVAQKDRAAVS